ncbi:TLC domain-containing protein 4-B [Taenia solium]|eukprot:TsM_000645400 transcript=TsM_000645400 gene=TsM_000645400
MDFFSSISRPGCIALSITIGYMLADTISMFTFQRGLELLLFCTHHLIVAICFTFLLIYRIAPIYAIIRLTSEISTPFLNQRWFYRTIGGENAGKRAANATLVFACLFTLGRYVLPFPYWVVFYRHFNSKPHLAVKHKLPSFTNYFISCPVLLDVLNAAWGYPVFIVTKKALATLGYIRLTPKQSGMSAQNGGVGSGAYCNGNLHEE